MKNLIYKELRLSLHPTCLIFLAFGMMLLIPGYPYYVAFFYTGMAVFFTCLSGRENNDLAYMMMLPVRKSDTVKARIAAIALFELAQVAVSVPFAVIRNRFIAELNPVGMEANIAFFGLTLLMLGLFNLTFFTSFYRNPDKVGKSFVSGSIAVFVYMAIAEVLTHVIPFMRDKLDTKDPQFLLEKLAVLAVGIIGFALLTLLAYKRSAKSFAKLDL